MVSGEGYSESAWAGTPSYLGGLLLAGFGLERAHHLARVTGVHAVVARGGCEQHLQGGAGPGCHVLGLGSAGVGAGVGASSAVCELMNRNAGASGGGAQENVLGSVSGRVRVSCQCYVISRAAEIC